MHGAKRREKLSVSDTRFFGSCQPAGAPRGTTMASHDTHPRHHLPAWAASYDVRLSLIVAACLLVEAVVAKEVLDVELDYFSQLAALWVFIAYLVTGRHDRSTARAFALAAVLVTAAVLGLYAL